MARLKIARLWYQSNDAIFASANRKNLHAVRSFPFEWLICNNLCFIESNETLHEEIRDLKVNHFSLKEKYDEVSEKMRFFTKV